VKYEVGIIGLGSIGSMAIWQLARKGVSVIGFEQFGIGHDRSAAGGESRLFRMAYQEGAHYVPLLKEAKRLWRELEQETNKQLLTITSGLTIGHRDAEFMQNVLKSVNEFDIDHEILSHELAKQKYPQHILQQDEMMVVDKEAGFLRPEHAVLSAVQRAKHLGAKICPYTKVINIQESTNEVSIQTNEQTYQVEQLIITAGPWMTSLVPEFKQKVQPKKIILSWFPTEDIRKFEPDQFPVFTRRNETHHFFGAPSLDHSMVKIGTSFPVANVADPNQLNRTVEVDELKDSLEIVKNYFRWVHPDPIRVSAYMDAYSSDDHSLVGRLPGSKRMTIAGGFSGHGFKMATVMGKKAGDIALIEEADPRLQHLNPERLLVDLKVD
jgi:sarcosine oxidase